MNSILAGILIGIGGLCNAFIGGTLGAFLFSIGLISVLILNANLYTGKVCDINQYNYRLIFIFLGNLIGAMLIGVLTHGIINPVNICVAKLATPQLWLVKSILCGIFIGIAVKCWKQKQSEIPVILSVMGFILTGSEHVIANIYYFTAAQYFNITVVLFILICLIGNTLGGLFIAIIDRWRYKCWSLKKDNKYL